MAEQKVMAPDRPGRYVLRNGAIVTILCKDHAGEWISADGCSWYPSGQWLERQKGLSDIVSRAPDDSAWCLAQARLLCPEGYQVVPVEPTEAMLACLDTRNPPMGPPEKLTKEYSERWIERHRRANGDTYRAMIASAVEGKL